MRTSSGSAGLGNRRVALLGAAVGLCLLAGIFVSISQESSSPGGPAAAAAGAGAGLFFAPPPPPSVSVTSLLSSSVAAVVMGAAEGEEEGRSVTAKKSRRVNCVKCSSVHSVLMNVENLHLILSPYITVALLFPFESCIF